MQGQKSLVWSLYETFMDEIVHSVVSGVPVIKQRAIFLSTAAGLTWISETELSAQSIPVDTEESSMRSQ